MEAERGRVKPLAPAALRASWLLGWLAAAVAIVVVGIGLRGDAAALGVALVWGAAAVECTVGLALVTLALKEAVPGSGVTARQGVAAIAAGVAVHAAVTLLTWFGRGMPPGAFPPAGLMCLPFETAIGVPALAIALLLVARAYAVRPRWAGLLGGSGSGLLADGVWHMVCPLADLPHLLLVHTGAVAVLALAGWLAGVVAERVRIVRLPSR